MPVASRPKIYNQTSASFLSMHLLPSSFSLRQHSKIFNLSFLAAIRLDLTSILLLSRAFYINAQTLTPVSACLPFFLRLTSPLVEYKRIRTGIVVREHGMVNHFYRTHVGFHKRKKKKIVFHH